MLIGMAWVQGLTVEPFQLCPLTENTRKGGNSTNTEKSFILICHEFSITSQKFTVHFIYEFMP